MKTCILGGGLSALTLARGLEGESLILEKEERIGGLCRSFSFRGVMHDVGPHIIFSKNQQALATLNALSEMDKHRRSNRIYFGGKFVKYPFENDLSALPKAERDYCVRAFLHNPYRDYTAANMLQFYLKIFGEGITRLYLQPYNQKIWKFDPSFMDTQMVERIPRPPDEDIVKSARGAATEGYTHQLYFTYPKTGAIEALVHGTADAVKDKTRIETGVKIKRIEKTGSGWKISTEGGDIETDRLINCMPIHELFNVMAAPDDVRAAVAGLKYNSIHIVMLHVKKDSFGDNFAVNFADSSIVFHRLSKIGFMGGAYKPADGGEIIMVEVTYRGGMAEENADYVRQRVQDDLCRMGAVRREDILACEVRSFKYAYVIYDLDHRKHADLALGWLRGMGVESCGRFAEFEYINMDAAVDRARRLAEKINGEKK